MKVAQARSFIRRISVNAARALSVLVFFFMVFSVLSEPLSTPKSSCTQPACFIRRSMSSSTRSTRAWQAQRRPGFFGASCRANSIIQSRSPVTRSSQM